MPAEILDAEWLEEVVGDFEIPCDLPHFTCHRDGPARWIIILVRCPDCHRGGPRLVCEDCKSHFMDSEDALECRRCSFIVVPARKGVQEVLPL